MIKFKSGQMVMVTIRSKEWEWQIPELRPYDECYRATLVSYEGSSAGVRRFWSLRRLKFQRLSYKRGVTAPEIVVAAFESEDHMRLLPS